MKSSYSCTALRCCGGAAGAGAGAEMDGAEDDDDDDDDEAAVPAAPAAAPAPVVPPAAFAGATERSFTPEGPGTESLEARRRPEPGGRGTDDDDDEMVVEEEIRGALEDGAMSRADAASCACPAADVSVAAPG